MSKFKIIDGSNITSIDSKHRELRQLQEEIDKNDKPTDKDHVTYAYHLQRLGSPFQAQIQLNKLSFNYFDNGIFVDLFHSLLSWALIQNDPHTDHDKRSRNYEYFVVARRASHMFLELNFETKPAFRRFRTVLAEYASTVDTADT